MIFLRMLFLFEKKLVRYSAMHKVKTRYIVKYSLESLKIFLNVSFKTNLSKKFPGFEIK